MIPPAGPAGDKRTGSRPGIGRSVDIRSAFNERGSDRRCPEAEFAACAGRGGVPQLVLFYLVITASALAAADLRRLSGTQPASIRARSFLLQ